MKAEFNFSGDSYSANGSKTWVWSRRSISFYPDLIYLPKIHYLSRRCKSNPIRNFAVRGANAEKGLKDEIEAFFGEFPAIKTQEDRVEARSRAPENTYCPSLVRSLFSHVAAVKLRSYLVIFIGIQNVLTDSDDVADIFKKLFAEITKLYVKAGARNFVIIDVPPIDRSPQGKSDSIHFLQVTIDRRKVTYTLSSESVADRVEEWNFFLQNKVLNFAEAYTQATVFLFSSHRVLKEILEDPERFGFDADDPDTKRGRIWRDKLHLTSEIHDLLAERLYAALFPSES